MDMREMFTIDGRRFSNMAGFYDEVEQVFICGLDWKIGRNLNAFNDILRGGFGRHEYGQPIHIQWLAYEKSVRNLGKETMDTIVEIILDTDHSGHDCIYLQSFAPDMDLQEFEERVCCVMENRMLVDVIDRALLRLKRYPDRGELYYEILTKQFIHRFNSTEKELLDELNMERSVFYDRKREAIFLLSLCLFGYAVPELQEELEMPRLYPD